MVNLNNCCAPGSVGQFLTCEAAPKVSLGIITVVAMVALGALTMSWLAPGFVSEFGFGASECALYSVIGLTEMTAVIIVGMGFFMSIAHCQKHYLEWKEKDLNNPTPTGTAIEMTETAQTV